MHSYATCLRTYRCHIVTYVASRHTFLSIHLPACLCPCRYTCRWDHVHRYGAQPWCHDYATCLRHMADKPCLCVSLYMPLWTCLYMCSYICLHACLFYAHAYAHAYINSNTHVHTHAYINSNTHIHTRPSHTSIHMSISMFICMPAHTSMQMPMHDFVHVSMHMSKLTVCCHRRRVLSARVLAGVLARTRERVSEFACN